MLEVFTHPVGLSLDTAYGTQRRPFQVPFVPRVGFAANDALEVTIKVLV